MRSTKEIIKFADFCKGYDLNGDRVSKNDKIVIFALGDQKVVLVSYEKYGTLSINFLKHHQKFVVVAS